MLTNLLDLLSKVSGCSFAALTYTVKGTGEVAKYSILLGGNTANLYGKDVAVLQELLPTLEGVELEAATELLASRVKSLDVGIGNNPDYTCADTYVHLPNLPGVKIHKDTGALYVTGLVEGKVTISPAITPKKGAVSPKAKAKRRIGYTLPSGRFRTFALGNVARLAAKGEVLEIE